MSKRKARQEKLRKQKNRKRLILILIVSGVALVAAALLIIPSYTPLGEFVKPDLVARPLADGNSSGNPDAPVLVEEFSDFGCSHCRDFAQSTEKLLVDAYVKTGKVRFVYRSVGSMLPNSVASVAAAQASYCAADQNKFWEYHDYLFANQTILNANRAGGKPFDRYLIAYAKDLHLDMAVFESCFNSGKYADRVAQDERDARSNSISGTPGFMINGELLAGNLPFEEFQRMIEAALAKSPN